MTTTSQAPPQRTALLIGAVITTVVVAGAIVLWGLIALPAFPSLLDAPDPTIPGLIVALEDGRGDAPCVRVFEASGATERTLACYDGRDDRWPDSIGWTADGDVVVSVFGRFGPRFEVFDPVSADLLRSGEWEGTPYEEEPSAPHSASASSDIRVRNDGGRLTVTVRQDGDEVTLVDVEAPRSYSVWEHLVSPDGAYLLLVDSEQRLLLVPADGSAPARLLAEDVRRPGWWIDGVGGTPAYEVP